MLFNTLSSTMRELKHLKTYDDRKTLKIVKTNTECNPGFSDSSSKSTSFLFGTHPNAYHTPHPLGVQVLSEKNYNINKVSPLLFIVSMSSQHESSREHEKKTIWGRGTTWGRFNPWSHHINRISYFPETNLNPNFNNYNESN